MSEQAYASANPVRRYFRFGAFEFGYISPLRWELAGHGLGVMRRTPWGAMWGWWRWRRAWRRMTPAERIGEQP